MASTIEPRHLSASTNGRPIAVAATASPGTLIHTATNDAGGYDQVTLWASNVTGSAVAITLEWGGTGTGDQGVAGLSVPANSAQTLLFQGRLSGGVLVRAFAGTAAAINITGKVERFA